MPEPDEQQHDAGDAMRPAPERFAGTQQPRQPRIRKFQRKPGDGKDDEAGGQHKMLPALRQAHAHHRPHGHAIARGDLAQEQQRVVNEHRADGAENQDQINPAHPPVDLVRAVAPPADCRRINVHVDFAGGELFVGARMTFAAGLDEVGRVDGRIGVG